MTFSTHEPAGPPLETSRQACACHLELNHCISVENSAALPSVAGYLRTGIELDCSLQTPAGRVASNQPTTAHDVFPRVSRLRTTRKRDNLRDALRKQPQSPSARADAPVHCAGRRLTGYKQFVSQCTLYMNSHALPFRVDEHKQLAVLDSGAHDRAPDVITKQIVEGPAIQQGPARHPFPEMIQN